MVNPKALPYEELIATGIALGIIDTFTQGRRMDRVDLEREVERRQFVRPEMDQDDQYGEFKFR